MDLTEWHDKKGDLNALHSQEKQQHLNEPWELSVTCTCRMKSLNVEKLFKILRTELKTLMRNCKIKSPK